MICDCVFSDAEGVKISIDHIDPECKNELPPTEDLLLSCVVSSLDMPLNLEEKFICAYLFTFINLWSDVIMILNIAFCR